ncbi:MAG: hypothetical protein IKI50_02275 [Clostridia bacterium]|nr:hypothetical protein [Clostridia bacterium]
MKYKPLLIGALRAVCLVLLTAALAGGIASFLVRTVLLNRDFYLRTAEDPAYCEQLLTYVRDDLEADCDVYRLPFSLVEDRLDTAQIGRQNRQYFNALYDALTAGGQVERTAQPVDGLYDAIERHLLGEGFPAEQAAEDAAYLSEQIAERVSENVAALAGQKFLSPLSQYLFAAGWASWLYRTFWFWLGSALVLAVCVLLFGAERFAARLYRFSAALFIAASAFFFPALLLRFYDLPGRLPLADSPLKLLIATFWNRILSSALLAASVALAAAVLAAGVSVVLLLLHAARRADV